MYFQGFTERPVFGHVVEGPVHQPVPGDCGRVCSDGHLQSRQSLSHHAVSGEELGQESQSRQWEAAPRAGEATGHSSKSRKDNGKRSKSRACNGRQLQEQDRQREAAPRAGQAMGGSSKSRKDNGKHSKSRTGNGRQFQEQGTQREAAPRWSNSLQPWWLALHARGGGPSAGRPLAHAW